VVEWARNNLRDLPWRRTRDPWLVLVAEYMLQQTQVCRVIDRWAVFVERYPDPAACASASQAAIVRDWEGLGYNRRAVMLHRAAVGIVRDHGGLVPSGLEDLLALPGVGPYTARAVQSFAFETTAAPVDTNIGRVLARLVGRTLTGAEAQRRADAMVPVAHPWLHNQGLMELGATVCTKRAPACERCPLGRWCSWRGVGEDPADGSAGSSRPQSRFEGSDRELRGRLVDTLRRGPIDIASTEMVLRGADRARRLRVVAGLVEDGLIESVGGRLRLSGEVVTPAR
jgi:A/G-specific adenine glycosylase